MQYYYNWKINPMHTTASPFFMGRKLGKPKAWCPICELWCVFYSVFLTQKILNDVKFREIAETQRGWATVSYRVSCWKTSLIFRGMKRLWTWAMLDWANGYICARKLSGDREGSRARAPGCLYCYFCNSPQMAYLWPTENSSLLPTQSESGASNSPKAVWLLGD